MALVEFDQPDDAQSAIRDLDNFILGGIPLMIHKLDEHLNLRLQNYSVVPRANFWSYFSNTQCKRLDVSCIKKSIN